MDSAIIQRMDPGLLSSSLIRCHGNIFTPLRLCSRPTIDQARNELDALQAALEIRLSLMKRLKEGNIDGFPRFEFGPNHRRSTQGFSGITRGGFPNQIYVADLVCGPQRESSPWMTCDISSNISH